MFIRIIVVSVTIVIMSFGYRIPPLGVLGALLTVFIIFVFFEVLLDSLVKEQAEIQYLMDEAPGGPLYPD